MERKVSKNLLNKNTLLNIWTLKIHSLIEKLQDFITFSGGILLLYRDVTLAEGGPKAPFYNSY